jgi:septal ring factor EnvC (AmiA/AmiB activator)
MDKAVALEPTADETARLQADIKEMLAEMNRLREQMKSDDADTEKSQARTRAMLAQIKALF